MHDFIAKKFPIGRDRFVTVEEWSGAKCISVRQYVRYGEGDKYPFYPTKKGVSLTLDSWIDLMFEKDHISEALDMVVHGEEGVGMKCHIGRNIYATVETGKPQWFLPEGGKVIVPMRNGICLSQSDWGKVCVEIEREIPHLKGAIPCSHRRDHDNQ